MHLLMLLPMILRGLVIGVILARLRISENPGFECLAGCYDEDALYLKKGLADGLFL